MSRILRIAGFALLALGLSIPGLGAGDVTVPCPGEGVDSSAAITDALLSLRPGGTVRLQECTYYLSGPVVVTGSFNGALRGAGVGKTILTTLRDYDGIEDVLMLNWITELDEPGVPGSTFAPTLFHFSLFPPASGSARQASCVGRPNRVAMSDLTIEITDPDPAFVSARMDFFGGALLAIITVEGVKVSTDFERLDLKGSPAPSALCGFSSLYGIEIWGELSYWPSYGTRRPMTGQHVLRRSVFEDVCTGYNPAMMARSRVLAVDNRFVNPGFTAFLLEGLYASNAHVSGNDVELSSDSSFGIYVELSDGTLVNKNRIAGLGAGGIYVGSGSRYKILNNDLSDLTVPAGSYAIVLGADTSDSLVVGADPSAVLDLGTNNRILPGWARH